MNDVPFVSVVWKDAWADATDSVGQNDHDAKHKPTIMETRGWLLQSDEAGVSVFNERCLDKGDDYFRSRTFVPRELVQSVTEWKLVRPRQSKPKAVPAETPPTT